MTTIRAWLHLYARKITGTLLCLPIAASGIIIHEGLVSPAVGYITVFVGLICLMAGIYVLNE